MIVGCRGCRGRAVGESCPGGLRGTRLHQPLASAPSTTATPPSSSCTQDRPSAIHPSADVVQCSAAEIPQLHLTSRLTRPGTITCMSVPGSHCALDQANICQEGLGSDRPVPRLLEPPPPLRYFPENTSKPIGCGCLDSVLSHYTHPYRRSVAMARRHR